MPLDVFGLRDRLLSGVSEDANAASSLDKQPIDLNYAFVSSASSETDLEPSLDLFLTVQCFPA